MNSALGNGLHENLEQNLTPDATRSAHLNDTQEGNFFNTVNQYADMGDSGWSLDNVCSGFAADAWESATGEDLRPYVNIPATLADAIYFANGAEEVGVLILE